MLTLFLKKIKNININLSKEKYIVHIAIKKKKKILITN